MSVASSDMYYCVLMNNNYQSNSSHVKVFKFYIPNNLHKEFLIHPYSSTLEERFKIGLSFVCGDELFLGMNFEINHDPCFVFNANIQIYDINKELLIDRFVCPFLKEEIVGLKANQNFIVIKYISNNLLTHSDFDFCIYDRKLKKFTKLEIERVPKKNINFDLYGNILDIVEEVDNVSAHYRRYSLPENKLADLNLLENEISHVSFSQTNSSALFFYLKSGNIMIRDYMHLEVESDFDSKSNLIRLQPGS